MNQDKIAVQKELQELQPVIDEITDAIQSISKNELMELAKIVHPTKDMQWVCGQVCLILSDATTITWT